MRSLYFAFLLIAIATTCAPSGAAAAPPAIDGAWVLDGLDGFMGQALFIKGTEFKFWEYSDLPTDPRPAYPIIGKVEFDAEAIRLRPAGDAELFTDAHWRLIVHRGEICLITKFHLEAHRSWKTFPNGMLLRKLDGFDEKKPVLNFPHKGESKP